MKSDQQALVERVRKRLKKDPKRSERLRVEWDAVATLLAGYMAHIRPKLKVYEAHQLINHARAAMLTAFEAKVADRELWIHAMHGAGFPAAPHPKEDPKCSNV